MLILAIIIALIVDVVAVLAAVAAMRRFEHPVLRYGTIGFAGLIIIGTTVVASLATVPVQARIVMAGMRRQEPTKTILGTDKLMRQKLEAAVYDGLEKTDGSKVENVKAAVEAVLRPYMKYRLSHAPDKYTIASATATLGMLERAKAAGPTECASVLSGDMDTVRRLATPETSAWLGDMLKADEQDQVDTAKPEQVSTFVQTIMMQQRWQLQDVNAALRRSGPLACDAPITLIRTAVSLPDRQAAPMLRGLGFGAQAMTR